jgi:hypothetical protein
MLFPERTIGRRDVVQMRPLKAFAVEEQEVAELGLTDTQGIRQHGFEYGLHVAR